MGANVLKLFLDIVPSSSADVTRALRECFRGEFYIVSFRFKAKANLQRCGDVFFDILITSKGMLIHSETLIGV